MVEPAEEDPVVGVGGTAEGRFDDVVDFAPRGRDVTPRNNAPHGYPTRRFATRGAPRRVGPSPSRRTMLLR
jgi:hypothetical protein